MEFYIAQGISVITGILAIFMMQQKSMKRILFLQVVINLTTSINYLLLGGDSGAVISLLAIIQSIVMFIYSTKDRKPHIAVIIGFILCYIGSSAYNIILSKDPMELLPALAAVCFAVSIVQKNASAFRIWGILNSIFWMIYDLYTHSYVMFCVHAGVAISTLIGIIRIDIKGKNKK
ncbi:MAG: YgjV family protein [Clostridia bacterium]|nr:YgjV family protein [Clostridia bacterium]